MSNSSRFLFSRALLHCDFFGDAGDKFAVRGLFFLSENLIAVELIDRFQSAARPGDFDRVAHGALDFAGRGSVFAGNAGVKLLRDPVDQVAI